MGDNRRDVLGDTLHKKEKTHVELGHGPLSQVYRVQCAECRV